MTPLPDLSKLDPFSRRQPGVGMVDLWPVRRDGRCACGCGSELTGRRTRWATDACSRGAYEVYAIYTGVSSWVRRALWERDQGACRHCGVMCRRNVGSVPGDDCWEADHIIPVEEGGGACYLDNLQTLCVPCHRVKTAAEARARATRTNDPHHVTERVAA